MAETRVADGTCLVGILGCRVCCDFVPRLSLGPDHCYPGKLPDATSWRIHRYFQHHSDSDVYLRDGSCFGRTSESNDYFFGHFDWSLFRASRYVSLEMHHVDVPNDSAA